MIADVMIIIILLVTYDLLLNSIIVGVIQNVHCHVGFCLSEGFVLTMATKTVLF